MSQRNHFLEIAQLRDSDRLVLLYEAQILVRNEKFIWSLSELDPNLLNGADIILLEDEGGSAIVAVNTRNDISDTLQAEARSLRSLLFIGGDTSFTVAGRVSQLLDWYNTHRYCGTCGNRTIHHGAERAVVCEVCKIHYFPRINPCAIMLVVKGDQLLLARSSRFNSGFFSCLAGFVEIGETPEETVAREVMEEVGLEVENIRYIKSQSWPFPSQLMLGFVADYKSGEITPEPSEIAEAHWYDIDNLPNVPSADISVAGELIQHFIAQVRSSQPK
ncbi:MAG: NAD(+) diphosphatase [SAR86 cluster bacterium]|uniref:NAD(+) diphosphatase n=1 Tax=SAR86 cluster bacterium TaxID=2030880 RepID=A0A2A5BAQ1_9GAMM|nr:MAG: NAD(+) diphosphatase [SAR86 cluster bacterium]